MAIILWYAIF